MTNTETTENKPMALADDTRTASIAAAQVRAALWLEGVGALSVQMLAIRQIAPWTGQTVIIVAVLISSFLSALAIGYAWGARGTGGHSKTSAARMLLVAAGITTILASRPGADLLLGWTTSMGAGTTLTAAVYALALVIPVALCTGRAVVLMATSFERQGTRKGAATILAWSTWGNVAGGLATPLIVMQLLGTESAVALAATCLAGAAMLCATSTVRTCTAALIALTAWTNANVDAKRGSIDSAYAHYIVTHDEEDDSRILWANGTPASRHDPHSKGWPYAEYIEDALWEEGPHRQPDGARIAILGAAGMTIGEGRSNRLERTFVDVEPNTITLAKRLREDQSAPDTPVAIADARAWIAQETGQWDAIVLDLFNGSHTPPHVMTREWFEQVRSALRPQGVMVMNIIVTNPPQRFARRMDNTIRSIFADCTSQNINDEQPLSNRVYFCRKSEHDGDRTIYRDTRSQAQSDAYAERHGQRTR